MKINTSKVIGLQFSIFSPEEIERRSVAEIVTQEGYESDIPKIGGLFDPRMGVLENGKLCPTDKMDNKTCPGYFGHINLAVPVFYLHLINWIIKFLKCTCWKCSKILIQEEKIPYLMRYKRIDRFNELYKLTEKVPNGQCPYCDAYRPKKINRDQKENISKIKAEWEINKEKEVIYWSAEDVLNIFKKITDEDLMLMGLNPKLCRPDWLICTKLNVPPPYVRPSVRNETNTRMEDDITHKLCDIIKTNRSLRQKMNKPTYNDNHILEQWIDLLQRS